MSRNYDDDDDDDDGSSVEGTTANTTITTNFTHSTRYDADDVDEESSTAVYYWNENDPREYHPGRYKKLRKLAVLATTVKPPHESLYYNTTGITNVDDWCELVEHHILKLQQQQQAQEEKQRLKQLQNPSKPPAKKKPKPAPVPLKPNPRTSLPGIQLRTHKHHRDTVAFEDGIDFSSPVEVVRHQKLLWQFVHFIMKKAQTSALSYPPTLASLPAAASPTAQGITMEDLDTDTAVGTSTALTVVDPGPDATPTTVDAIHQSTLYFHNVLTEEHFASRISMHNPAAVSHLVILELHVPTLDDATALVQGITNAPLPQPRALPPPVPTNGTTTHHNSNVVLLPTTWYHTNGTEPLSITEKLMYQSTRKDHKKKSKKPSAYGSTQPRENTIDFIYEKMKPFALSCQQWENENYPSCLPPEQPRTLAHESPLSAVVDDEIQANWDKSSDDRLLRGHKSKGFTMMEWREAREFIQPYQIRDDSTTTADDDESVMAKDDGTKIGEGKPSLPPFVSHHHPGLMFDKNGNLESTKQRQPKWCTEYEEEPSPETRRIFAIDCEMVETEMGKELALVTICEMVSFDQVTKTETIDVHKQVLVDSIVQPYNRITNYLTKYSGISASTYDDADNCRITAANKKNYRERGDAILRLEQVQAILLQVIHPCDIVIGHSLENDLHALRFIHPTVVDTAIMFQRQNTRSDNDKSNDGTGHSSPSSSLSNRSFKYSLRHLAAVLLQKEIQDPESPHCSQEDAFTAMDLAVRRAVYGPLFCINNAKGDSSNWFTKLSHQGKNPITAVAVGPVNWLRQHVLSPSSSNAIHALQCESIDDSNSKAIVRWVTGPTRRAGVVWSKMELPASSKNGNDQELNRMMEWVQDVIVKLSSNNSVVLMIPIQINYSGAKELHQQRQVRRGSPRSTIPWSDADEKHYQTSLETCRKGHVLYITAKV